MWPVFNFVCVCVWSSPSSLQYKPCLQKQNVFGLFEARLRERHSFRQLRLSDCRFF